MIYHVNGTLEYCEPGFCVIDCSGVGYKLTVSDFTFSSVCGHMGEREKLFTYLQVREDGVELYGFATETELASFKLLITVSGVGPKAAMSILSLLSPEKFALAVCTEDKKTIAKANGIGPKTAARIILELKDKLMKEHAGEDLSALADHSSPSAATPLMRGTLAEATDALIVLGYSKSEAQNVLKSLDTNGMDLEAIIRAALKKLMKY